MKIDTTPIFRLRLTELKGLDPVEVIIDQISPFSGKITLSCFGKAWTAHWGNMGTSSVQDFFCANSNDYLIGCLSRGCERTIPDKEGDCDFIKRQILAARRASEIDAEEARELYLNADLNRYDRDDIFNGRDELLSQFLGPEPWHLEWPTKVGAEYAYLERICDAVRAAFHQINSENLALQSVPEMKGEHHA